MRTDVVIVNWRSGRQLQECVESLFDWAKDSIGRCIIVDNNSGDGSCEFALGKSGVLVIQSAENLGFAKACNLGASKGQSEYILFLNPDARLVQDSIAATLAVLEKPENSHIGIAGVQLIESDGSVQRTCARFPTSFRLLAKSIGLSSFYKPLSVHMTDWPHQENRQVDHVIGAHFVVRRSLFEALGGFDERFFVYLEDVDLSRRAATLGYKSVYLASAQAFHKGGGVSEQVKAHRLFYSLRSRILYAFKHFSWPAAVSVSIATLIVEFFTRFALLGLRGRISEWTDLLRGYGMLWSWCLGRLVGRLVGRTA